MAAKKNGMHSLHVKNHTVGTSNEISFSVLDAKKQESANPQHAKAANPLGKVALFSLPGTKKVKGAPKREEGLPLSNGDFAASAVEHDPMGTTTLGSNAISGGTRQSGFSEGVSGSTAKPSKKAILSGSIKESAPAREMSPEQKSAVMRNTRRVGIVAVACALIAFCAYSAYSVARGYYEDYLTNQSYQQILASSLSDVVEADEVLSEMDRSFENLLSDESIEAMEAVQDKLRNVSGQLDKAQALALHAQTAMSDQKDLKAAEDALDTIALRRTMLAKGTAFIEDTLEVHQKAQDLKEAWNNLLQADTQVRVIVAGLQPLDAATVDKTATQAAEAVTTLQGLEKKFSSLENTYDDLDLSSYKAYLQLRQEALRALISSCEAITAEDIPTATAETARYNEYDARATQLASSFADDISTLATDAYFARVDAFAAEYGDAASKAAALDTSLREYLRTTSSK